MKVIITVLPTERQVPKFECGDYFITDSGAVRQIIQGPSGYMVVDPEKGQWVTAIIENTPNKVIKEYVRVNGSVEKVKLKELILNKTNEIIKVGDL